MTRKLIIIMANSDPRNVEELGAPIFQASVAAALEYEVEVVCTATAHKLMKKGVAERLLPTAGSQRTLYDFIKDACEAGVKFYCCSPNSKRFACIRKHKMAEDRKKPWFGDICLSKLSVSVSIA